MKSWELGELDLEPQELIVLQTAYEKFGRTSFTVSRANVDVAWDLFKDGFLSHRAGRFSLTNKGVEAVKAFGYRKNQQRGFPTTFMGGVPGKESELPGLVGKKRSRGNPFLDNLKLEQG